MPYFVTLFASEDAHSAIPVRSYSINLDALARRSSDVGHVDEPDHLQPQVAISSGWSILGHGGNEVLAHGQVAGTPILIGNGRAPARAGIDLLHNVLITKHIGLGGV